MKTKLLLIITLGISIAACSDESTNYEASTAPTYEEPNTETYSEGKRTIAQTLTIKTRVVANLTLWILS